MSMSVLCSGLKALASSSSGKGELPDIGEERAGGGGGDGDEPDEESKSSRPTFRGLN